MVKDVGNADHKSGVGYRGWSQSTWKKKRKAQCTDCGGELQFI